MVTSITYTRRKDHDGTENQPFAMAGRAYRMRKKLFQAHAAAVAIHPFQHVVKNQQSHRPGCNASFEKSYWMWIVPACFDRYSPLLQQAPLRARQPVGAQQIRN
jgi:hypothetical protein